MGVLPELPDVPTKTLSDLVQRERVLDDTCALHALFQHPDAPFDSSLLDRAACLKSKSEALLDSIPATSPALRMPELSE